MTQYLFLRHAEATDNAEDHEKPLSAKGEMQARHCKLPPFFCDLMISSSAKRALQTAQIIRETHYPKAPLESLSELYLPPKNPDLATVVNMLNHLGGANLNQYLAEDREGAWKRYCKAAYEALMATIQKQGALHVLIVAHANIINDLGLHIAPQAGELRSFYFAPCTGFLIQDDFTIELII